MKYSAVIAVSAIIFAACAASRAASQWPHASVASVAGAKEGKCSRARQEQIEAALRSLTAQDLFNWRMATCNCGAMTLEQALYNTEGGGNILPRNAILITLRKPISVPLPSLSGKPFISRSLIVQRDLIKLARNSTMFFGIPRPRKMRIDASVVYVGWGLKGDPFGLKLGECK